jgi:hypothetical protein
MQLSLPKSLAHPRGASQATSGGTHPSLSTPPTRDPHRGLIPSRGALPGSPVWICVGRSKQPSCAGRSKQPSCARRLEEPFAPGSRIRRRREDSFAPATAVRWAAPGLRRPSLGEPSVPGHRHPHPSAVGARLHRPRTSVVRLRFSPSARRPHSYNPYQIMLKS